MAKETILKERGTGEALYPRTHASLVMTSSGASVEEALEGKAEKEVVLKKRWTLACTFNKFPRNCIGGWDSTRGYWLGATEHLTAEEVIRILEAYHGTPAKLDDYYNGRLIGTFLALIPPMCAQEVSCDNMYRNQAEVREIRLYQIQGRDFPVLSGANMFADCALLESIPDTLRIIANVSTWQMFSSCPKLREVRVLMEAGSLGFPDSPLLSYASVQYTVNGKTGTGALTLTFHADTYAKLTGDTTNAACAALTQEERAEWSALCVSAAGKGITIASA